jgi:ABC-2 type transport system permease protein
MPSTLKPYIHYAAISIRAQMQYRVSFLLQSLGHFLITGCEFLGLAVLFHRFGTLKSWTLAEVGFFYGIIGVAFAFAESIPRGFDVFSRLIRSGDFDRLLLRPRSTAFQVASQELQLMRVGRFTQAFIVLIVCAGKLSVAWTIGKIALTIFAILGGACLFTGLFILQATLCFWTVESIEILNCTTYGGVEAAQYPLSIYTPRFRQFFTFVVPLATINYFPAHAILSRIDPLGSSRLFQCLSPIAGVGFLIISLWIWTLGVRRYTSTGS